jgi:hypothetical protein
MRPTAFSPIPPFLQKTKVQHSPFRSKYAFVRDIRKSYPLILFRKKV